MINNYASEYGTALYKLACEENAQKEIFEDLSGVAKVFEDNPELKRLLSNPRLSAEERAQTVEDIFGGRANRYLVNMLKILAEKRIFHIVPKCRVEYEKLYCEANGILAVTATSAVELSESQKQRLIQKLSEKTGSKILLTCKVDKACLGGIRLEYGGKRFDASVKNKLEAMKKSLMSRY